MLDRLFGVKIHDSVFLFSLIVIAIGMPFGKAILSIGMVLMIINFFAEANFKHAFYAVKNNIPLLFIVAYFLFYIIATSWSIDFYQGWSDVKSRVPLIALPVIIVSNAPLTKRQLSIVLHIFLASLLVSSLVNFLNYNNVFGPSGIVDIRDMSLFGSHIRFAILLALGIGVAICFILKTKKYILLYLIAIVWLLFYTYFSQVLSGYISVIVIGLTLLFYSLWKLNRLVSITAALLFFGVAAYYTFQFLNFEKKVLNLSTLPVFNESGAMYYHSNEDFSEINGEAIHSYYVPGEITSEWSKVSKLGIHDADKKGHAIITTILRYMTAKGLTKDSIGFQKLNKADIANIHEGYTYPSEKNEPFRSRINGLRFQLINNVNPNGHSLLQRFEYWKTSLYLIKKHGIFGVGTGGNQKAFDLAYEESNSSLLPENRCRSHNMFFSILIGQGVIGISLFILMLLVLLRTSFKLNFILGVLFLTVMFASFFIEDTLETQLGVTTFGFFSALILTEFERVRRKSKIEH